MACNNIIKFQVTKSDKEKITLKAKLKGLTTASYIRNLCFDFERLERIENELLKIQKILKNHTLIYPSKKGDHI